MRKIFLLSLMLIFSQLTLAQESTKKRFTNSDKEYNDWYASLFVGANSLQNTDLVSWGYGYGFNPGYDVQLQLTKEVTHAFGISLMGQHGRTSQFGEGPHLDTRQEWEGRTTYYGLSLIGDLNLSMLFRRIDNKSQFKWAWHVYAGAGILAYEAERKPTDGSMDWATIDDVKFNDRSIFAQVGTGVRHRLSRRLDLELRAMYVMTGDEEFDASGEPVPGQFTLADIEEGRDDNMLTLSLGLHYKFGKHDESLQWHDPLRAVAVIPAESTPCMDTDNDGVCDFLDRCPDTPEGMAVDGAGCPLDADGDGVPDSIDECPTIPGPPTNNGCPLPLIEVSIGEIAATISNTIQGIEFDFDSDVIRQISYKKLDEAYYILEAHPNYRFIVEGHTDAAGSAAYNQNLSERRAASVVRYLVNKGIPSSQLIPVGKGKSELKHPQCDPPSNCPAVLNLENRRVIFKPYDDTVEGIEFRY